MTVDAVGVVSVARSGVCAMVGSVTAKVWLGHGRHHLVHVGDRGLVEADLAARRVLATDAAAAETRTHSAPRPGLGLDDGAVVRFTAAVDTRGVDLGQEGRRARDVEARRSCPSGPCSGNFVSSSSLRRRQAGTVVGVADVTDGVAVGVLLVRRSRRSGSCRRWCRRRRRPGCSACRSGRRRRRRRCRRRRRRPGRSGSVRAVVAGVADEVAVAVGLVRVRTPSSSCRAVADAVAVASLLPGSFGQVSALMTVGKPAVAEAVAVRVAAVSGAVGLEVEAQLVGRDRPGTGSAPAG